MEKGWMRSQPQHRPPWDPLCRPLMTSENKPKQSLHTPIYIYRERNCWLLEFYSLATSRVITGQVPTYDNVHSWHIYSAAPLGDQATRTRTLYPTESHWANQSLPIHLDIPSREKRNIHIWHKDLWLDSTSPLLTTCVSTYLFKILTWPLGGASPGKSIWKQMAVLWVV